MTNRGKEFCKEASNASWLFAAVSLISQVSCANVPILSVIPTEVTDVIREDASEIIFHSSSSDHIP
jgi:hypothetical protein